MTEDEIRTQTIEAREDYIGRIKAEMMGPGSEFSVPDAEHEWISDSPTSRYSVGILFPQGNPDGPENAEESFRYEEEETEEESEEESERADAKNDAARYFPGGEEEDGENLDEEIGMAAQYKPSSTGMTFLVSGNCDEVTIRVRFATYRKALPEDCVIPYTPNNPAQDPVPPELCDILAYDRGRSMLRLRRAVTVKEVREIFEKDMIPEEEASALKDMLYRMVAGCSKGYVRVPHDVDNLKISFSDGNYVDGVEYGLPDDTTAKIVALRTRISEEIWSVSVMLVNASERDCSYVKDCIFQAQIEVATKNNAFHFVESGPRTDASVPDEEEQSLNLLYRKKKTYGSGMGTSVTWEIDDKGYGYIRNDYFPMSEVPAVDFSLPENPNITDAELSMKYLSDLGPATKEEKLASLTDLVRLYEDWIKNLEKTEKKLDAGYRPAASKNIAACRFACERMYRGIATLRDNENAYRAFSLANRAMFMQRIHLAMQEKTAKETAERYPDDKEISKWLQEVDYRTESDRDCRWRPFQIAFLLLDLKAVVDDRSEERSLVDLIWFPTGGGKTEAYLGLTAFLIFYRRLSHLPDSSGTAVMMRYTLRLLAAQQFTRAATLICACEFIRRDCQQRRSYYPAYPLGKEPVTIGLWIGGSHIPNTNKEAKYYLDNLNKATAKDIRYQKERNNKFQVLKCPWCGTKLVKEERDGKLVGKWGYAMKDARHFYLYCPQEACSFTDRLPIQIVDEELYGNPPTMLFGTVDKFAMMAWDGRIGAFFGIGQKARAPELIIQDELHLISGALGTMVGLYETAVDEICSQKGIPPKIIASTATIRRAAEQCSALYDRQVCQFPPSGLDASDSFFSREAVVDCERGKYGRRYIGLMPSGKTKAMAEARMMAALLQETSLLNVPDEIRDKFWTLTAYFNSLKELGKASTLVGDDVRDFVRRTAHRHFAPRRVLIKADELTSRVTTTELNETLDKLEKTAYSKENREAKLYASDVLLATNMISVGIDVARLNVMLMVGQPKLTSEYIQASSRVGRAYPGAVFVLYDATRSRDRSHYEQFLSYHESFYRFVEPTGVTPFSKPARERALHAVLVAILRQKCKDMRDDKDAGLFDRKRYDKEIRETESYILQRIRSVQKRTGGGATEKAEDVKQEMDAFFEEWEKAAEDCRRKGEKLFFGRKFMVKLPGENEYRLLKSYSSDGKDSVAKPTLTSMRNVDTMVTGYVIVD